MGGNGAAESSPGYASSSELGSTGARASLCAATGPFWETFGGILVNSKIGILLEEGTEWSGSEWVWFGGWWGVTPLGA